MEISEQQRLNDLLIAAIKAGDADAAISLLQQGADPNAEAEVKIYTWSSERIPALELALRWHVRSEAYENWLSGSKEEKINPALVKGLVKAGADVNARTSDVSSTPLENAAWMDEPEIATYLLDHGADLHQKGSRTGFPLYTAVDSHSLSVVQLLLERGADPNQTHRGLTPLKRLKEYAESMEHY